MSEERRPLPEARPTLEYAGATTPVRVSRLAVLAVVVAVLGSPFLLMPLFGFVKEYGPEWGIDIPRRFQRDVFKWGMIAATAVPVVAVVHIAWSRGKRRGMNIALVALLLSLVWWVLMALVWVAWLVWRAWRAN